jgi:hypothetical protein
MLFSAAVLPETFPEDPAHPHFVVHPPARVEKKVPVETEAGHPVPPVGVKNHFNGQESLGLYLHRLSFLRDATVPLLVELIL